MLTTDRSHSLKKTFLRGANHHAAGKRNLSEYQEPVNARTPRLQVQQKDTPKERCELRQRERETTELMKKWWKTRQEKQQIMLNKNDELPIAI